MSTLLNTKLNHMAVNALIVRAAGTNCDQETIHALTQAGAECHVSHINQLLTGRVRLHPFHMLVIPGGFSYGDDISAGKVLANELRLRLKDQLQRFIESKKLVIGICNGFQVLVKAGLLPGFEPVDENQTVTLGLNDSARFQCHWTKLKSEKSAASWLDSMPANIELPIAHGEGKFMTMTPAILSKIKKNRQVVFRYAPNNPNGSQDNIAGICNAQGNVIGMMPHPERFVTRFQHPNWPSYAQIMQKATEGKTTNALKKGKGEAIRSFSEGGGGEFGDGFWFWEKAVQYAKTLVR